MVGVRDGDRVRGTRIVNCNVQRMHTRTSLPRSRSLIESGIFGGSERGLRITKKQLALLEATTI